MPFVEECFSGKFEKIVDLDLLFNCGPKSREILFRDRANLVTLPDLPLI
jgi:hypothetical protein